LPLIVLARAIYARYGRHRWADGVDVITSVIALYFNVFVVLHNNL